MNLKSNLEKLIGSINSDDQSVNELINHINSSTELTEKSKENIITWLDSAFSSISENNLTPRSLILDLFIKEDWEELNNRFFENVTPGTAGIRGKLGIGSTRINEATVGMFAEAHARYLKDSPESDREGIVLGGDSRNGSYDKDTDGPGYLQKMAALIYAEKGIPVYLCDKPMPTPLVSFAISELPLNGKLPLSAAINTASHNPSTDNGFKIYESKGHQVVSVDFKKSLEKHISNISSFKDVHTAQILDKWPLEYKSSDTETVFIDKLKTDKAEIFILNSKHLISKYVHSLAQVRTLTQKNIDKNESFHFTPDILKSLSDNKIVVTTLNGNGWPAIKALLEAHGMVENVHFFSVEEENIPDGSFPVGHGDIIGKPNPEYPENFYKAVSVALENKAKYVIAADPDSDRIGIGIVDITAANIEEAYKKTRFLNGNEQLSITLSFLGALESFNEKDVVIQTRVSSRLYEKIAAEIGINIYHVLVGFKYFGQISNYFVEQLISKIESKNNGFNRISFSEYNYSQRKDLYKEHNVPRFVHGGEESMGQNMYDFVFDKDTPATVASFAEILGFINLPKEEKQQIIEKINPIYLNPENSLAEILVNSNSINNLLNSLNDKFGMHQEYLYSVRFEGEKGNKLKNQVMAYFRDTKANDIDKENIFSPLKCLAKADYKISAASERSLDLSEGAADKDISFHPYSFSWDENSAKQPLDSSDYLTFFLENNSEVHIRPSGTEPMVKVYFNFQGSDKDKVSENIEAVLNSITQKLKSFS